jgi:hypothetical protein
VQVSYQEVPIDFSQPFRRVTMAELVREGSGIDFEAAMAAAREAAAGGGADGAAAAAAVLEETRAAAEAAVLVRVDAMEGPQRLRRALVADLCHLALALCVHPRPCPGRRLILTRTSASRCQRWAGALRRMAALGGWQRSEDGLVCS